MEFKNAPDTVDAILEKDNKVLMIKRKGDTFKGHLAMPGGYVDYGETVEAAVIREAKEELNLDVTPKAILGVYSGKKRDPRGAIISIVFICDFKGQPRAGDDASDFEWLDLKNLEKEKLAFDHKQILTHYKQYKKNKGQGTFWTGK